MAGKMRFRQQAQPGDPASLWELMPLSFAHRAQVEFANNAFKQRTQQGKVGQRRRGAPVSFDDPLDSVHPCTRYGWA